jgi:hypothetical protein
MLAKFRLEVVALEPIYTQEGLHVWDEVATPSSLLVAMSM